MQGDESILEDLFEEALGDEDALFEEETASSATMFQTEKLPTTKLSQYSIDQLKESVKEEDVGVSMDLSLDDLPQEQIVDSLDFDEENDYQEDVYSQEDELLLDNIRKNGFENVHYSKDKLTGYAMRCLFMLGNVNEVHSKSYMPPAFALSPGASCVTAVTKPDGLKGDKSEVFAIKCDLNKYSAELQDILSKLVKTENLPESLTMGQKITEIAKRVSEIRLPEGIDSNFGVELLMTIREFSTNYNLHNVKELDPAVLIETMSHNSPERFNTVNKCYNDVINYIDTVLNIYSSAMSTDAHSKDKEKAVKKQEFEFLIKDNLEMLETYKQLNEDNHMRYIRQILVNDSEEFFVRCPVCGKIQRVETPIVECCIAIIAEKQSTIALPIAIQCECETNLILTSIDLCHISTFFPVAEDNLMKQYRDMMLHLKTDSSISHLKLSVSKIYQLLQLKNRKVGSMSNRPGERVYLFDSYDINLGKNEQPKDETFLSFIETTSDDEYRQAVKLFYQRLDTLDVELMQIIPENSGLSETTLGMVSENNSSIPAIGKNEKEMKAIKASLISTEIKERQSEVYSKLDYSEIALYIATTLSLDYQELKNHAILSLLFAFKENKPIADVLDYRDIWYTEKSLDNLDYCLRFSKETIPRECIIDILAMLKEWNCTDVSAEDFDYNDLTKKAWIMDKCVELKASLEDNLQHLIQQREELIDSIEKYETGWMFTKIIHISTASLAEMNDLLVGERFCSLVQRIADRMIITNHANAFFSKWRLIADKENNFVKALTNAIDDEEALNALLIYIKNHSSQMLSLFPTADESARNLAISEYFTYARNIDALALEHNYKAYNALKVNDYYTALKEVDSIQIANIHHYSKDLIEDLEQSVNKVKNYNQINYKDYSSPAEFYLTAAGFTTEEIHSYKGDLQGYVYSIDIPLRENNESIAEYFERWHQEDYPKTATVGVKYTFDSILIDLIKISSLGLIAGLEFHDYLKSMFITSLTEVASERLTKPIALRLLGMSPEMNKIIARKAYNPNLCRQNSMLINRILNGFYFTLVGQLLKEEYERYRNILLYADHDLEQQLNSYNIQDELTKVMNKLDELEETQEPIIIQNKKDGKVTKEFITDYNCEEMKNEFYQYLEKAGVTDGINSN